MYLSQTNQEDLKSNPGQLEEVFASSDLSEEFDPAAIDEILNEGDFLDPFDEEYDNRLDFFALRLLSRINDPNAIYDDSSESDYCGDYLDDNGPEQVPYPLRILDEAEEDSDGIPNLRLVEEDSDKQDIIPGEEPENQLESDEEPEEELSKAA
jgi:hypothetical protein